MPRPVDQSCASCRFCVTGLYSQSSECHINPPTDYQGGFWPRVHTDDWCGRYEQDKQQQQQRKE